MTFVIGGSIPSRAFVRTLLCTGTAMLAVVVLGNLAVAEAAQSRTFRLNYSVRLTGLQPHSDIRVWLPVPGDSQHQQVKRLTARLPGNPVLSEDPIYGNKILYLQAEAPVDGTLSLRTTYRITRHEVRGLAASNSEPLQEAERELFLQPNRLVPSEGAPVELLAGMDLPNDPLALGRTLYDRVDALVRYDKSQPGYGQGDVLWVCDSRFGNCSDFHSLFISFARAQGFPARFEIGFPLPPERGEGEIGGYHCWASFYTPDVGWVPVDISEADKHPEMKEYYFGNLTENRVAFSVGRDIELVPDAKTDPLNFFVYPHVEVDGQALPREQLELKVSYEDLQPASD